MNRVNYPDGDNLRVELGSGNPAHQRVGLLHLDINDYGQDIVWDITKGLPFRDNSVEYIYASHIFEHIHREDLILVFNECWRVLKKRAELHVIVPAWNSDSGFIIPHYTRFTESTFNHLTNAMNPDYKSLKEMHSKELKSWETIELITNERPDIHWRAIPRK